MTGISYLPTRARTDGNNAPSAELSNAAAVTSVATAVRDSGSTVPELQACVKLLSKIDRPDSDKLLVAALADLVARPKAANGMWSHLSELELDVVEAASRRNTERMAELLGYYREIEKQTSANDPLTLFKPAQRGGNAANGRSIFSGHRKAQCLRCHKVNGLGGDAGPDLSKVAKRSEGDRRFLLESLINPHAKLAKGYGTITAVLEDGKVISGTVDSESETTLVLRTSEGRLREILVSEIEQRVKPKSPMPPVGDVLTLRELRDVIEYLSTLR